MRLRVLFLGEFHSKWGGGEVWMFNLIRELRKLGVDVITMYTHTPHVSSMISNYAIRAFSLASSIRGLLSVNDFDIIHVFKMFSPLIVLPFSRGRPIVTTLHDIYGVSFSMLDKGVFIGFLRGLVEVLSIKCPVRMFLVPSVSTASKLVALGISPKRIRVVGAGVNLDFIDSIRGERSYEPEIVFVGRLVRHKHPELIIKLSADLGVRAHIVGSGPLENWLRDLTSELGADVVFHGLVSGVEKVKLLKRCWALVLPSEMEGFGLVLAEALACRTPVVAFDCGGPRDIVIDGVNGFLVPIGDYGLLCEKVDIILQNERLRDKMGIVGRRLIESRFTWEAVAKRVFSAYREVLGF